MKIQALLLLAGASLGLALPKPKINAVHYPKLVQRPAVEDYVVKLFGNVTVEPTSTPVEAPKKNVWLSLTTEEAAGVASFLHNQTELNLTASADAGTWDNSLGTIDLAPIDKAAALKYLDHEGEEPERYATAIVFHYASEEPYAASYIVGPLPVSEKTTYKPDTKYTNNGSGRIRVYDADDDKISDFISQCAEEASDIVKDLLGKEYSEFDIWGIDPLWHEDGHVVEWVSFWGIPSTVFDGETLLPQGLFFKVDITGRDPSKWFLVGWLYNGEYYTSTAALREATKADDFKKLPHNLEGDWIGTDQTTFKESETVNNATVTPPPLTVSTNSKRFKVDLDAKYITWMDFSFYVTFTRDTGMRLFDIRYKGQRIIYELGLQEAIAHYAGNDPVQSGTAYLDTWYGFGPYAFELLPGYDCPTYATFLNTTFHENEISTTHRNGLCVFEHDAGYPIQRHSSQNYVSATMNTLLTLRSVSTVGNYDYTFEYNFYLDGSVETIVRASGYIQSAFFAKNDDYGYHIHKALSGSMHDHCLNWKMDVDILGTENTVTKHTLVAADVKYPWSNYTRSTMHLKREDVTTEDDGKMYWSENAQSMLLVVNKNKTNDFGEARGYRLAPSVGNSGMHLTIKNSSNLFNSQGFATHPLYVTKRKEEEAHSAHALNDLDTRRPLIDFSKYFDGESLEQEDLVLWFNLGMHHVPHTGDLPNTVMTTAQGGMMFSPHNYLSYDPSRDSSNMIRINYNSSNASIVENVMLFGQQLPSGTIDLDETNFDYYTYEGDTKVRKFPYDPLNPYNETDSIV